MIIATYHGARRDGGMERAEIEGTTTRKMTPIRDSPFATGGELEMGNQREQGAWFSRALLYGWTDGLPDRSAFPVLD